MNPFVNDIQETGFEITQKSNFFQYLIFFFFLVFLVFGDHYLALGVICDEKKCKSFCD